MKLRKTLAVSFIAATALLGSTTAAQADGGDAKFRNNVNSLLDARCTNVEVITLDIPIIGNANNQDCSRNVTKRSDARLDVDGH